MSEAELSLASGFPRLDAEAWRRLAESSLKGQSLGKLSGQTADGVPLLPIYARETHPVDERSIGLPGEFPYTRGAELPRGNRKPGWDVRQRVLEADLAALNRQILSELERGAGSLELCWDRAGRAGLDPDVPGGDVGVDGVALYSVSDLDSALAGVDLELAPIVLDAGPAFASVASLFLALLESRGVDKRAVQGELGIDPLAALATEGWLHNSADTAFSQMVALSAFSAEHYPRLRSVQISTRIYSDAGATDAQELGIALATGVCYLRALLGAGLSLPVALGELVFELSVNTRQLEDIAKLRAMRLLWARVCQASATHLAASDAPPAELPSIQLGASVAWRGVTRRDPWVNMLRATMGCFSAAVGGASSISLLPYTAALGDGGELAQRIARNTQLVLMEEAHLARVSDPAGGSYAVEALTRGLADAAWKHFQQIEAAGGLRSQLESGAIAEQLSQARAARRAAIARRKQVITGVSEFPNIHERPVQLRKVDLAELNLAVIRRCERQPDLEVDTESGARGWIRSAQQGASLGQLAGALAAAAGGQRARIEPLKRERFSAPFDELRERGDTRLRLRGSRPKILLACIGPIAEHTARASFSKNFFEAGGIEAVSSAEQVSDVFDPAQAAAALKRSGAELAVLCSTDALYESHAEKYASALHAAGAKRVYLAGHPKAQKRDYAALPAPGQVDGFIYVGADLLEVLSAAHDLIGAKS